MKNFFPRIATTANSVLRLFAYSNLLLHNSVFVVYTVDKPFLAYDLEPPARDRYGQKIYQEIKARRQSLFPDSRIPKGLRVAFMPSLAASFLVAAETNHKGVI